MTVLRPRSARLTALALLAALAAVLVPGIAQAATDDVTWTVRTASNTFGQDRTSFTYALDPGATVRDGLVIANRGTEPLDLGVYAADGYTTDSGQLDLLAADQQSKAVGAWLQADSDHVVVAPGDTATIPFTVTIPQNATPGDYAGGIVTSLKGTNDTGISVDRRLGIRVNLRVGGELLPAMTVDGVQVTWNGGLNPFAGGDATVTYTLHNSGNAVLGAQEGVTVAGPFGWFATDAAADAPPQILPGESWTQTVTVPGIAPLFLLMATVTATPIVVDASGSTTGLAPIAVSGTGWAVPWMLLIIVLVVAALVVATIVVVRRRRATEKAREDARVAAAVAEALEKEKETAGA